LNNGEYQKVNDFMNRLIYKTYEISLLILFLQSLYAWFLWDQLYFTIFFSAGMTIIFALTSKHIFYYNTYNIILVFLLIIIELYYVRGSNVYSIILGLLKTMIISTVLLLNDQYKNNLFRFITKTFAIIMGMSVIWWILFLIGIPLPHYPTNFSDGYYNFENYYLFLLSTLDANSPLPRFSGYFLEPGYLGMITTFLLVANRFNLKDKYVRIIFIATLITFSLNAYILLLISMSIYLLFYSKNQIKNEFLWGIGLVLLYLFFTQYNNGNNTVNNLIIYRMKFENGILNRFSDNFDNYYNTFMNSGSLKYWGIGIIKYNELAMDFGSAGYKVLILVHGFIGTGIVLLFYFSVALGKQSKMALILLLVYMLSFLQAPFPLMECTLLIFITAMPILKSIENNDKKKKYKGI
jgi:hypothetical protein